MAEDEKIQKLKGANMDIDFEKPSGQVQWVQDQCPWNLDENTQAHQCAVKHVSICKHFRGIQKPDVVLCAYPKK